MRAAQLIFSPCTQEKGKGQQRIKNIVEWIGQEEVRGNNVFSSHVHHSLTGQQWQIRVDLQHGWHISY
jgi:hypothetical protein